MTQPTPRGSIRLFDEVRPGLTAGRYRASTAAEVRDHSGAVLPTQPAHQVHLDVGGPRFALPPTEVALTHPASGSAGAFGDRLPHVALSRRTLPFERRVAGGSPWLALLVLADGEGTIESGTTLRQAVGPTTFSALAAIEPIEGDGPEVDVLRARDAPTLAGLLPTARELRLLTHVRQVNIADTELAAGDDDGWFAVVVANRIPVLPGAYTACLVSLEGLDALVAGPVTSVVPLVVLHRWGFSVGEGGSFEHVARALDVELFGGPHGSGTVALSRVTREGDPAEATYRGPLVADPPPAVPRLPDTPGDMTRVAAYELGRLLAIADGRFSREIVAWHRTADDAALVAVAHAALGEALAASAAPAVPAPRAARRATAPAGAGPAALDRVASETLERVVRAVYRPGDPWGVPSTVPKDAPALGRRRKGGPR